MGKKRKCCNDKEPLLVFAKGDLIQKILVWLPVVSLGRFKSVCKSWCTLIESSLFIDLHTATTFNSSSSSAEFGSFILLVSHTDYSHETKQHALMTLSSVSGLSNYDDDQDHLQPQPPDDYDDQVDNNLGGGSTSNELVLKLDCLRAPSYYEGCRFYKGMVGSCNGLVCFYDRMPNKICLWNPVTKQKKILPKPTKFQEDWPHHSVAFGFDVETKDYKVLQLTGCISNLFRPECICQAHLYSLSTGSWKLLEGITSLPGDPFDYPGEEVCLNGSCFFMTHFFHAKEQPCFPENDRFLISFDFTKEIITPMQLPDHHQDQELHLSHLGDKIALFTSTCPIGSYGNADHSIWVLNEHGSSSSVNKESWTKLHSFQMEVQPGGFNIPRGISNDGVFALIETSSARLVPEMSLYHLEDKEVKWIFLSGSVVLSKANAYKPSLVSIIGANGRSSHSSRNIHSRHSSRNIHSSRSNRR